MAPQCLRMMAAPSAPSMCFHARRSSPDRSFTTLSAADFDMSGIFLSAASSRSSGSRSPPPAPAGPYDLIRVQQKQLAHLGIMCDGCTIQNFSGPRFKCEQCPDFDLCSSCYDERNTHAETGHSFMVIYAPGEGPRPAQARGSRSRSPPALPAPPPPQQQELQHAARIAMQQQQQQAVAQQAVAPVHNVSMQPRSKPSDHSPPPSADLGDVSVLVVLGAMRRWWCASKRCLFVVLMPLVSGSWSLGHGAVKTFLTKHLPSAVAMCKSRIK